MVPIDGTTLVDHRLFVLGGHQEVSDGPATFEVSLNAISTTYLFDTFTKTLCVGYDNVTLILDNIGKQTELCRSQLASILSAQRLKECFIEKLVEIRFTKVKQRQLNKFNNLLNKKEGNITGVSMQLNSSQGLVTSQAGRQASAHLPSGEGSNLASQAGRQVGTQLASQAGSQASAHLSLGEGSSLASQAGSQAGAHLPLGEGGSLSSQVGRQSGADLPFGEGCSLASQAGRQASRQADTYLPLGEGSSLASQTGSNTDSFSPSWGWHFLPGRQCSHH